MFEKLRNLIHDRKRSEEEYKIVIQVLERCNSRSSKYATMKGIKEFGDLRAYDYNDLKMLPDIMWGLIEENKRLEQEVITYKERVENIDSVIKVMLDNIDERYNMKEVKRDSF